MYKASSGVRWLGCLVPLAGFLGIATCAFHDFFDVSSDQSAAECEKNMAGRIMDKVNQLPADDLLRAKHIIVEHWLTGNREQTEPLAAALRASGKNVEVAAREVGTDLIVRDKATAFRRDALRRIEGVCAFAEAHRLKYDSWWVTGDRFSDYVSQ